MKNQQILCKKIARLESINDQLTAEIRTLDRIAKALGFSEGLKTLKAAAMEMIDEEKPKIKKRPKKKYLED